VKNATQATETNATTENTTMCLANLTCLTLTVAIVAARFLNARTFRFVSTVLRAAFGVEV